MNRANQAALFQQTNLGLLSIRQAELNYYVSLNIAFGTQAALIGGFTYGVFTQNQNNDDNDYSKYFQDIYWIVSAGTIACAVHVIITTMCIQVFGPGLALHGPVGSMARAAEGMRIEQKPVIVSFILMMVLFSIATILSFWAVFSFPSAVGGTVVFLIASRQWYFYCERIYLRFYWQDEESKWRSDSYDGMTPNVEEAPVPPLNSNPIHEHIYERRNTHQSERDSVTGGGRPSREEANSDKRTDEKDSDEGKNSKGTKQKSNNKPKGFFRLPRFTSSSSSTTVKRKSANTSNNNNNNNTIGKPLLDNEGGNGAGRTISTASSTPAFLLPPTNDGERQAMKSDVIMEGYLLKKVSSSTSAEEREREQQNNNRKREKENWERRYFILTRAGHLFLYKSRQDYRSNPKQPIYFRPLDLHDYVIDVFNSEGERDERQISVDSERRGSATGGGGHRAPRFELILRPKEEVEQQLMMNNPVGNPINNSSSNNNENNRYTRQTWYLRCDTEEELEIWAVVMREAVPTSFFE
jgi:hypothetical protein